MMYCFHIIARAEEIRKARPAHPSFFVIIRTWYQQPLKFLTCHAYIDSFAWTVHSPRYTASVEVVEI